MPRILAASVDRLNHVPRTGRGVTRSRDLRRGGVGVGCGRLATPAGRTSSPGLDHPFPRSTPCCRATAEASLAARPGSQLRREHPRSPVCGPVVPAEHTGSPAPARGSSATHLAGGPRPAVPAGRAWLPAHGLPRHLVAGPQPQSGETAPGCRPPLADPAEANLVAKPLPRSTPDCQTTATVPAGRTRLPDRTSDRAPDVRPPLRSGHV